MAGLGAPLLVQAAPARAAMPQPANLQRPTGVIAQATPTLPPVLLQALESALNARDDGALAVLLRSGPGLDPAQLRQSRQLLRQQFPDATWRVRAGTPSMTDGAP